MADTLNERQKLFVLEYLKDLNGTRAAISAGYSAKSAEQGAVQLLRNIKVKEAIDFALNERKSRATIDADRVLVELARLVTLDVRRIFNSNGRMKEIVDLDDDVAAAVSAVEVVKRRTDDDTEEYIHKVRFWSKTAAIDTLAKHLGMLKDRVEHTGKDGRPIEVKGGLSDDAADMIRRQILGVADSADA